MSHLQYRMRTGKHPQGRQKIYFCCHPDDFDLYFDLVCQDIFDKEENCVIFYEADPTGRYDRDDLLFQLGEMQLFVVPITKRLLTQPSRALELELPFALGKIPAPQGRTPGGAPGATGATGAKETTGGTTGTAGATGATDTSIDAPDAPDPATYRHIAVLPILFEGGLVDLFNATEPFDGMQFLDRYTEDSSAISYGEKLATFLQSVIVSDEEDERIRAAFRAGIFLSYRKVDRALARRLMERIHQNELCRDVSIWYDEYLVPGESWADAIGNELATSDLFVLNVTDNLLEAGNFVWREEYPAARAAGKPILPVMTERTDEARLRDMYAHIEDRLVRDQDSPALDEGLVWGLVRKAGKKELLTPDDTADHLYYIGLAYKNSVGVEAAPDRAVALLEQAGERGWRRAYLTLGGMYEHGDGVERDEERAIAYYRSFIEQQAPDFGTSKQGDLDLVLAYDAIGMIYINRSRLADAFDTYAELNARIDAMTSCFGSFKQINLPTSFERLGFVKRAMGEPTVAQEYFSRALDARLNPPTTTNIATPEEAAADETAQAYNEFHMRQGLAVSLYSLGDMCLQNRDLPHAEEHLTRANELFAELAQEMDDRDLQLDLNKSSVRMAQLKQAQGHTRQVLPYYEQALAALEPLCTNPHDIEARSMRVVTKAFLSGWHRDSGRLELARTLIGEALDEAKELAEADRRPKMQNLLATTYERQGTIAELMGDTETAYHCFCHNIELSERLVEQTEDAEYRRGLAIAYEKAARLLSKRGRFGDRSRAIDLLYKDLELTHSLARDPDDLQAQRDLSVCYDALYQVFLEAANPEAALKYGFRGLVVAYDLAERIGQPKELYELGISYYDLARVCADIKDVCLANARALCEAAYRLQRDPQYKQMLKAIRGLAAIGDDAFPLGRGFCDDLDSLVARWHEEGDVERDYTDVSALLGTRRDEHPAGLGESGSVGPGPAGPGTADDDFQPSCASGCMQLLILMVIPTCALLQVTGLVDVKGFLLDTFGERGPMLFIGTLFVLYGLTTIRWKR